MAICLRFEYFKMTNLLSHPLLLEDTFLSWAGGVSLVENHLQNVGQKLISPSYLPPSKVFSLDLNIVRTILQVQFRKELSVWKYTFFTDNLVVVKC